MSRTSKPVLCFIFCNSVALSSSSGLILAIGSVGSNEYLGAALATRSYSSTSSSSSSVTSHLYYLEMTMSKIPYSTVLQNIAIEAARVFLCPFVRSGVCRNVKKAIKSYWYATMIEMIHRGTSLDLTLYSCIEEEIVW